MCNRPTVTALLVAALCSLQASALAQDGERERPPNIVVLFADDAGYADFGFQPHADPKLARCTPRITALANEGARFTDAYMSGAVCSPSRAGLLTGRYQQRFGHETNIPPGYMDGGMALEERTVADHLSGAGMATGLVGKWHLGYPADYHPNRRGFDWFHGLLQGSRGYGPMPNASAHRVIQENGEPLPEVGWVTDRFGKAAARFVAEHRDEPFFLFVSFTAPHGPLQPAPEDLAAVEGIEEERRKKYAGLVVGLDRAVGRVLDALEEHGVAERTLVVFTNDNGGQTQTGARNEPLRGRKGQLWEGGIRVPMAMRWPGRIEPGTVIGDPVSALDLMPTFLAAHGVEVAPEDALDGVDLVPLVTGSVDRLAERALFWRTAGSAGPVAVRRGSDKLVLERGADGETVQLFDLSDDIGEEQDLAPERGDRVRALRAQIAAWESGLIEPLWGR